MINLHLRFYEELNDFLPVEKRKISFIHTIPFKASIKDVIESLGVPHTEIDLILANGKSVDFSYAVQNEDHISIYPVFESLDISELVHLRPQPLRTTRFILDVHLGKLARYLRLLGLDTYYENHLSDEEIITRSQEEHRIILTRDIGLLKNKKVTHGYWVRHTNPDQQIKEVLDRFDLYRQCHPFTRCLECNGLLEDIEKNKIIDHLLPLTNQHYHKFVQCTICKKIYWEGTHYQKLKSWIRKYEIPFDEPHNNGKVS